MGEAKRNRERLAKDALEWLERWSFQPTPEEAEVVNQIKLLPTLQVTRYPAAILAQMRMPPNQCHANARFMVDNDPEGKCRQVTGWWPQMDNYVLHSVVEREGEIFCVTPYSFAAMDRFPFIPDEAIRWVEEGDIRQAYRDGFKIDCGVRSDPDETMRINRIVAERIKSGMHPIKAGEPPF